MRPMPTQPEPRRSTEPDFLSLVGQQVRGARLDAGYTMKEAAARAGLSPRFFGQLESGQANIAIGRLKNVADALDVDLLALIDDDPIHAWLAPLIAHAGPEERNRCARAIEAILAGRDRHIIALLGLRGAGKSTVGALIARKFGIRLIEVDSAIEAAAGLSLAEIFALHGESYYRRLETRALAGIVSDKEPAVVCLSGGVVHNETAFDLVRRNCTTLWLTASPDDHMRRVVEQGDDRPMRGREDAMAELRALLSEREPLYGQADIRVDTSRLSWETTVDVVVDALVRRGWKVR